MNRNLLLLTTVILLALFSNGCVSKTSFEEKDLEAQDLSRQLNDLDQRLTTMHDSFKALGRERDNLLTTQSQLEEALSVEKDNVANLKMQIEELRSTMASQKDSYETNLTDHRLTIDDLKERLARLGENYEGLKKKRKEEVQKMSATYGELIKSMKNEIDRGQVTISELKGKLTVNLVDAVLFDSGKAEVKDEGLAVLQKVIDILMNVTDKAIRIEGHTDNVQIVGMLAKKYPTNWELSATRAINVSRFLQLQGLNPANLSAIAYGEYKPVAENDTAEGRAQNRRIEIILVAKE